MKVNEVIISIVKDLAAVTPNIPVEKIASIVDLIMTEWTSSTEKKLVEMIREWEDRVPDDSSLYTLGLRRALDVVRGEDPNDIK